MDPCKEYTPKKPTVRTCQGPGTQKGTHPTWGAFRGELLVMHPSSNQIWPNKIIFQQPRFPWNSRKFPFQNATYWQWPRGRYKLIKSNHPPRCCLSAVPGMPIRGRTTTSKVARSKSSRWRLRGSRGPKTAAMTWEREDGERWGCPAGPKTIK